MSRTLASYRHTRVLVLGASGFIGYWVARTLMAQGAHLTCAVRSAEAAERLAREGVGNVVVRRDLADPDTLRAWIPALRPMIIFNLAGYGVDRSERDAALAKRMNHELVERLALVAAALPDHGWGGLRLVHVGSALEYGTTGGLLAEDSPCAPTTLYGQSKLAGTQALMEVVRRTGLEACTARLFTVYGPGEHDGRLLPSILKASLHGDTLQLTDGSQRRDFAYVEDVAEGLLRLGVSDVAAGDVVNLASGTMQTVRSFVETTAGVVGLPTDRLDFGAVPTRPEEMSHDGVSVARLRAVTRWSFSDDIAEGVGRTLGRQVESEREMRRERRVRS